MLPEIDLPYVFKTLIKAFRELPYVIYKRVLESFDEGSFFIPSLFS